MAVERYLSTGTIARICQVSPMTIAKWIDQGVLPGHTTPGGHRRVAASDLVAFLLSHGMHVPNSLRENGNIRVLAIHSDPDYLGSLGDEILSQDGRYEYRGTTRVVDALVMIGEWRPKVVFVDLDLPDVDGLQICERLSQLVGEHDIRIVALAAGARAEDATEVAGAAVLVNEEGLPGRVLDVLRSVLGPAPSQLTVRGD